MSEMRRRQQLRVRKTFEGHAGRPGQVGGSAPRQSSPGMVVKPFPAPESAQTAGRLMAEAGFRVWIVGGAVRDVMGGKKPKDIDMATDATPEETKRVFRGKVKADLNGEKHGTVRVGVGGDVMELTTLRQDIETDGRRATVAFTRDVRVDLMRRDLSFNALAMEYDPETGEFNRLYGPDNGDPGGALDDLKNKTVRFVGDGRERIKEDHLRALRAIRIATKMGFDMAPETERDIRWAVDSGLLRPLGETGNPLSGERIRDELLKTLSFRKGVDGLRDWKRLGLLDLHFPELRGAEGQVQNVHHGDVTVQEHIFRTMEAVRVPRGDLSMFDELARHINGKLAGEEITQDEREGACLAAMRLTMLLHDIGKMATAKPRPERPGEFSFLRHEEVGAEVADRICRQLLLSNRFRQMIVNGVAGHMDVPDPKKSGDTTIRRWARNVREKNEGMMVDGFDPVDFMLAIRAADWGAKPSATDDQDITGEGKIREALAFTPPTSNANKPVIPGNRVMELTGRRQGPDVGAILRMVAEYKDAHPQATIEELEEAVRAADAVVPRQPDLRKQVSARLGV